MTKKLIISIQISLFLVLVASHAAQLKPGYAQNSTDLYPKDWPHIHANVLTDFNENISLPQIEEQAFIHPFGIVIGNCYVGKLVFVAPTAVCRGDEGTPIHVGDFSNMQDGVVLHGLETSK